jgi:hypothetical protein
MGNKMIAGDLSVTHAQSLARPKNISQTTADHFTVYHGQRKLI